MVHDTDDCSETMNSNLKTKEKKASMVTTVSKNVRESKGAGSRRIFSPMFKLQVLDSYRQDADCQGNQRATARKYGIHRRQIQKWLQMEENLRLSVQHSNVTALNLTSARQSDDGKDSKPNNEVKKITPIIYDSNLNNINKDGSKETCNTYSDSEEYVNVDEITDSEDDETSSCSSYERTDKALDFTCATLSKRRFYTPDFKLHVLDAFKNDKTCKGNQRATARKFGIHRRQVQKWLNQEHLIKSEQTFNNACLDLSSNKRKLEDPLGDPDVEHKPKKMWKENELQESALCLVKNKLEHLENNDYRHIVYPSSTLEHSYSNSSLNYTSPEYPLCLYQPWNCCYQQISAFRSNFDTMVPKYSYAFNVKYETSYVDIPVQYGFGDSVISKWIKENPLYVHEPPSIQILSSYR
ncbi:hypothetical protein PGB90_002927 [Kerria lacca]